MLRRFRQVDVFSAVPLLGNPVAVVLDGTGLSDVQMQEFARWTNLSETTFVTRPSSPEADYAVRIFTQSLELPFAGHPTLGTCHAWLEAGGVPRDPDTVVQECAAGLIPVHRGPERLAFAAPPLLRSGPAEEELLVRVAGMLGIARDAIVDAAWADNGPGWLAVLLADADAVLALRPGPVDMDIGVVGPHPDGSPQAFELRAFFPVNGTTHEDPVTGSLNASVAQWLLASGRATAPYVAAQGTAIERQGRVHIEADERGMVWVGGATTTCITGEVSL